MHKSALSTPLNTVIDMQALMPASVFLVGMLLGTETWHLGTAANMVVVTAGVAVASYGEVRRRCSQSQIITSLWHSPKLSMEVITAGSAYCQPRDYRSSLISVVDI